LPSARAAASFQGLAALKSVGSRYGVDILQVAYVAISEGMGEGLTGTSGTGDGAGPERPETTTGVVRQLAKTLPYSDVPWEDFERLLKAVAQREGWDNVDIYGDPGQKQFGIDIVGELPGGDFGAIQSKRYQTFDESDFVKAIEAFDPDKLPLKPVVRLIIATTVHTNRRQILDTKSALQADIEVKLEFWDGSDLDERLRKHPDVVQQFFGTQATKDFCGELPQVIAPAAPGAARIAEIVARGPGNLPEVASLVDEAASVAGVDPSRAASLYGDAQAILRKDGFDAHASTWDAWNNLASRASRLSWKSCSWSRDSFVSSS
jgi:hypothetical protein